VLLASKLPENDQKLVYFQFRTGRANGKLFCRRSVACPEITRKQPQNFYNVRPARGAPTPSAFAGAPLLTPKSPENG